MLSSKRLSLLILHVNALRRQVDFKIDGELTDFPLFSHFPFLHFQIDFIVIEVC